MEYANFYENFKAACARRGTNLSTVLDKLGRASGNSGNWKNGKFPRIDILMEMAEYLHASTDELIYGWGNGPGIDELKKNQLDPEWIDIINHIPDERQQICKDFLRTHMVLPEKYADGKNA